MEWTKYTTKEALKDNDELMILDTDGKANKRTLMDKIWDYVVDKMTTAVIAKLKTTNKTLIGAVNELNSKSLFYTIKPQSVVHITYQKTYRNTMLIIAKKSMYFYSNGYLTSIRDSDKLFITLSNDYKDITIKNEDINEAVYMHIMFGGNEIPIIK